MDITTHEPHQPTLPTITSYTTRHDGWTGEKIATFCETLAETAVVAEACEAAGMGISGAYAARRRNPVFAAAWDAALTIARERLADTLLARSMEGNIELLYRDGVVVGERHVIDNRLGLAILRRLDRLAEMGMAVSTIGQHVTIVGRSHAGGMASTGKPHPRRAPICNPRPVDWTLALDALRTGDDEGVAKALALIEGNEVEEVEGPPNPSSDGDDTLDLSGRCWFDDDPHAAVSGGQGRPGREGCWLTDFPPPPGFTGYESRPYDEMDDPDPYVRACTADEVAILEAIEARARAAERTEEEQLRDEWFAYLRADVASGRDEAVECGEAS